MLSTETRAKTNLTRFRDWCALQRGGSCESPVRGMAGDDLACQLHRDRIDRPPVLDGPIKLADLHPVYASYLLKF